MQTFISDSIKNTPEGLEADKILRSCVHCGFCTTHCPTYRLLGDELDSPRGRIYLIKSLLEGNQASQKTQYHLDRCLTCRSCETHCPSGVEYGKLLDIGRQVIEKQTDRPKMDKIFRKLLTSVLPYRNRFAYLLSLGKLFRPVLPGIIKKQVPVTRKNIYPISDQESSRRMILVDGCVQPSLTPETNHAARFVLNRLGIRVISVTGEACCGALNYHLAENDQARNFIKNNIDQWWPYIEDGVEAIVSTASGCGVMIKDYAYILRNDKDYADKAVRVSGMTKDIAEILSNEDIDKLSALLKCNGQKVAFQNPCTLQHGQKLDSATEHLLEKAGFNLTEVPDKVLCCGSAGTYSLLQRKLSRKLLEDKIRALESGSPDIIATANVGCQLHLQQATSLPVKHWVELVAENILQKNR